MISLEIIMLIIVTHFLADFALQTSRQAMEKSVDDQQLFYHVGTYSLVWLFISYVIFESVEKSLIFALITLTCHFAQDWYTSRLVKSYREKEDYHNMFVVIGADQVFHYAQLFITYLILR